MFEDLKKKLEQGLDVAFMNAEKVAQAAKDLANENKLNKEEAKKLYDYLLEKSESAKKTIEADIQQGVKTMIKKMDLVTQDDLKKLEARLVKLEAKPKSASAAKKAPVKTKTSGKSKVKPA